MILRKYLYDCRGNVAVIAAVAALPIVLAAGAAIDYQRIAATRGDLQTALDSAVLASAAKENGLDEGAAKKYFTANFTEGSVTLNKVTLTKDKDGAIVGEVSATIPLGLASLMGNDLATIRLTSSAMGSFPTKVASATFQITNAQGAYDKDIYLFTKDKDGKILTETLVLQYDYTYSGGVGTKKFTPSKLTPKTITVGPYETYGEKMVVYEDTTYTGKHINPKTYYSDDPNASKWSKIVGECTTGQTQNWEDGGDTNFLDFVFTLNCTTTKSGSVKVRLTK